MSKGDFRRNFKWSYIHKVVYPIQFGLGQKCIKYSSYIFLKINYFELKFLYD